MTQPKQKFIDLLHKKFIHLLRKGGTFDFICRHCFVTVATARRDSDLEREERGHVCESYGLVPMPTISEWQYIDYPDRGLILTGILGNDTRRQLVGRRIYTNTIIGVGIRGNSPVAVTKSGTAYRLLDPAPSQ